MNNFERWKSPEELTLEDDLLLAYWQTVGGLIFTEVSVGGRGPGRTFPKGSKPRRIDGVRIVPASGNTQPSDIVIFKQANPCEFQEAIDGNHAEVIEIKRSLGRYVIGQVIIGADLIEMAYKPNMIDQLVICQISDPLLEVICRRRNIRVWKLKQ